MDAIVTVLYYYAWWVTTTTIVVKVIKLPETHWRINCAIQYKFRKNKSNIKTPRFKETYKLDLASRLIIIDRFSQRYTFEPVG